MISPAHLNDAHDSSRELSVRNRDGYRGNRTDADVRAVSTAAKNRTEGHTSLECLSPPRARPGNAGQPL